MDTIDTIDNIDNTDIMNSGISTNPMDFTLENLSKLKKPELVSICKEKKLPISGTKNELIDRILNGPKDNKKPKPFKSDKELKEHKEPKEPKEHKEPLGSKISKVIKKQTPINSKPIYKKIREQFTEEKREPIIIKKNIHGNFEHLDTGLIFSINKKVIGVQGSDGSIKNLSIKDIENVYKYHFELEKNIVVNDEINNSEQELFSNELEQEKRLKELEEFSKTNES
jgi:hypothetical protein